MTSFVVALPPFDAPVWVPVFVGFLAFAAGIWVLSRGMRRPGWTAIGFGIVGIGLGVLATRASSSNIDQVVVWSALLSATLVWATPLTYAAIGGLFCERSGVVNIGLEGMMLAGAFFGVLGADKFNSWAMGLLTAAIAGGCFALLHAVFAIQLRADQIVGGTAINFLALGVTGYFFIQIYGDEGSPGNLPRIPNVNIPGLKDSHSFFGQAFGLAGHRSCAPPVAELRLGPGELQERRDEPPEQATGTEELGAGLVTDPAGEVTHQ